MMDGAVHRVWDDAVLQDMYRNEELCDVSLRGRGSEFACKAHSVCLAAASPVLRRMISWEMDKGGGEGRHNTVELVLPEIGAGLLRLFVEFVYTGRMPLESPSATKLDTVTDLGRLANFFDVATLRSVVEDVAAELLEAETCAELLGMSFECCLEHLRDRCVLFALDHFSSVSKTQGFLLLDEEVVKFLLDDDRLTCSSEEDVYHAVVQWVNVGRGGGRGAVTGKRPRSLSLDGEVGRGGEWGGGERGRGLLGHVRFALLSDDFVARRVRMDSIQFGWHDVAQAADWVLSMSPQERSVASRPRGGSGPTLEEWGALGLNAELRGHAGAVEALAFWMPQQGGGVRMQFLVSGSRDGSIRLWDAATSEWRGTLELPGHTALGSVYSLLVVGDKLFSGGQNKSGSPLNAWCLATQCHEGGLIGHADAVMSLQGRGETFLSGSWDRSIREWSVTGRECLRVLSEGIASPVINMMVCGTSVLFSGTTGSPQVWNLAVSGAEQPRFLMDASVSPVLSITVCSGPAGGGGGSIGMVKFVPDGRAVTGHRDGSVRVWDTASWDLVATICAHTEAVSALAAYGSWVVSVSRDCSLRVWDLGSRDPSGARCVRQVQLPCDAGRVVAHEQGVAVATKDRSIRTLSTLRDVQA